MERHKSNFNPNRPPIHPNNKARTQYDVSTANISTKEELSKMSKEDLINIVLKLEDSFKKQEDGAKRVTDALRVKFEEMKQKNEELENLLIKQMNLTEIYPQPNEIDVNSLIKLG